MEINELIDLLEMALPGLRARGNLHPDMEISNRYHFLRLIALSVDADDDSAKVARMHVDDFRKMLEEG